MNPLLKDSPKLYFPGDKPEFGNITQINAIKDYQRQIIEAEQFNTEAKEYEVEITWEGSATVRVRARDEEEAKELAHEHVDFSEVDDYRCRAVVAKEPTVIPATIVPTSEFFEKKI